MLSTDPGWTAVRTVGARTQPWHCNRSPLTRAYGRAVSAYQQRYGPETDGRLARTLDGADSSPVMSVNWGKPLRREVQQPSPSSSQSQVTAGTALTGPGNVSSCKLDIGSEAGTACEVMKDERQGRPFNESAICPIALFCGQARWAI